MKKIFTLVLVATLSIVLLTGCGNSGKKEANGIVRLALSNPVSMDTAAISDSYSTTVIKSAIEGLYEYDGKELVPAMAKSYEVSEDGLTYTFKLRNDGEWFDSKGKKIADVTANDFVYAWQRMNDPKVKAVYGYIFSGFIKNAADVQAGKKPVSELGVQAKDKHTLVVTLERETPYALELFSYTSFTPVYEKFVKEQGKDYGKKASTTLYNGAFHVTEFDVDKRVTFKKTKDYYDADKVSIKGLEYKIISDATAEWNAYKNGELDAARLSTDSVISEAEGNEAYKKLITKTETSSVFYIAPNSEDKIMKNVHIRKALLLSLDTDTFQEDIVKTGNYAPKGFIPKGLTTAVYGEDYTETAGDFVKIDEDKAKQELKLGLKDLGIDSAKDLTIEYTTFDAETNKTLAQYVQENWQKELGIKIKIKTLPTQAFNEARTKGNFQLITSGWGADFGDPENYLKSIFYSSNIDVTNTPRVKDKKLDTMIDEASVLGETEDRFKAFSAAEQYIFDQAYVIPVTQTVQSMVINEDYTIPQHGYLHIPAKYFEMK